jgi:hypothetical protein
VRTLFGGTHLTRHLCRAQNCGFARAATNSPGNDKDAVSAHVRRMHRGTADVICGVCDQSFKDKHSLLVHTSSEHVLSVEQCIGDNCPHSAAEDSLLCLSCGGGARCQFKNCNRAASTRDTLALLCSDHGGGPRCVWYGCDKVASRGTDVYCAAHGGGLRCLNSACATRRLNYTLMKEGDCPTCIWRAATNTIRPLYVKKRRS